MKLKDISCSTGLSPKPLKKRSEGAPLQRLKMLLAERGC